MFTGQGERREPVAHLLVDFRRRFRAEGEQKEGEDFFDFLLVAGVDALEEEVFHLVFGDALEGVGDLLFEDFCSKVFGRTIWFGGFWFSEVFGRRKALDVKVVDVVGHFRTFFGLFLEFFGLILQFFGLILKFFGLIFRYYFDLNLSCFDLF